MVRILTLLALWLTFSISVAARAQSAEPASAQPKEVEARRMADVAFILRVLSQTAGDLNTRVGASLLGQLIQQVSDCEESALAIQNLKDRSERRNACGAMAAPLFFSMVSGSTPFQAKSGLERDSLTGGADAKKNPGASGAGR